MNTTTYSTVLDYYKRVVSVYEQAAKDNKEPSEWPLAPEYEDADIFDPDLNRLIGEIEDLFKSLSALQLPCFDAVGWFHEWVTDEMPFNFLFCFSDCGTGERKKFCESDLQISPRLIEHILDGGSGFCEGDTEHAKEWLVEASFAVSRAEDTVTVHKNDLWKTYATILKMLHSDSYIRLDAFVCDFDFFSEYRANVEQGVLALKFFAMAVARGVLPWEIK